MSEMESRQIQSRLRTILDELLRQSEVAVFYEPGTLPFKDEMEQIREWIDDAGEYGLAYETLVATVGSLPVVLSGKAAIALLELALMFGYKSELEVDRVFDRRIRE